MPVITSPGVYDREIDLSLYTPAVSSLVVGMVGAARSGPVNKATLITTEAQFLRVFGAPLVSHYGGLAAVQALKELGILYYVRVASTSGADAVATATIKIKNAGAPAQVTGTLAQNFNITSTAKVLQFKINGGTAQTITLAEGPTRTALQIVNEINAVAKGVVASVSTGSVKFTTLQDGPNATILFQTVANSAYAVLGLTAGATTAGTNAAAVPATVTSATETFDTSANSTLTVQVGANTAVSITLTAGAAVTAATIASEINAAGGGAAGSATGFTAAPSAGAVVITAPADADGYAPDLTIGGNAAGATVLNIVGTFSGTDAESTPSLIVNGLYPGSSANNYSVVVVRDEYTNKFTLSVYNGGALQDSFQNCNKAVNDTDFYVETQVNDHNDYVSIDDQALNTAIPAAGTYQLVGGADGLVSLSDADYIGVAADLTGRPTGLQIFTNIDEYDALSLICVPGVSSTPVLGELAGICESRGDVMFFADSPLGLTPQEVVSWSDGKGSGNTVSINSNFGAIYWSWIEYLDAINNETLWTPPCGHMLRVFAYNDKVAEPWFAPAGYNRGILRGTVTDVEISPSKGERDVLFGTPSRINPIVKTREGIVCLGDKTATTKPSALDAINVRRLLIYIKKAFRLSVKFLLFEPNDPATWDQLVRITKPALADIAQRRGLRDFDVVCDESTNTDERVNRKEMHANVFLKPTLPVRGIQLNYVITRQDANFSEIEL